MQFPPRAKDFRRDLAQETLALGHRNFDFFNGITGREFLAWLSKVLTRTVANQERAFRQSKRDIRRETEHTPAAHEMP